jgi:large subunit ribosomal protein L20
MARVKGGIHARKRHRSVLSQARGYWGNRSRTFRSANEAVLHALEHAYRDRRARKGDFRRLWIQRINAAARAHGLSYSRLLAGLRRAGVGADRRVLADLAVAEPAAFAALTRRAKAALGLEEPAVAPGEEALEPERPDEVAASAGPAGDVAR